MSDRNSLTTIASSTRSFLETIWPDWQLKSHRSHGGAVPAIMSYSTCGRSSTFVQKVLDDLGMAAEVRHGWFQAEGSEARHAWVAISSWLVDVTADQFGADEVIVTDQGDSRYFSDIDVALPEFRLHRIQAVLEIWDRWLCSPIREKLVADLGAQYGFTHRRHDVRPADVDLRQEGQ